MQHASLLRLQLQKHFAHTNQLAATEFKSICSRYRQNPINAFSDLIARTLSDTAGFISESAFDGLIAALKYTNVHGKSLHGMHHTEKRHPESNAVVLKAPEGHKKLDALAFRLSQRYRNLPLAFVKFDRDHDGFVSKRDFTESVEELNIDLTSEDVDELFSLLDSSRQGSLTYDQFSRVKGDPHFPKLEQRTPHQPRYASVSLAQSPSPASRQSGPASVSPSRLYFGQRRQQKAELPSDKDPTHVYGHRTRFSEDIKELITNSYEREFLEKLRNRQQECLKRERKHLKLLTNAAVLRNEAIKERMEGKGERKSPRRPKLVVNQL